MEEARDRGWAMRELNIQQRAANKNKDFVLLLSRLLEIMGILAFVREQYGFKIYKVDGEWLRNNIIEDFEHAGHGFVHLPIPADQIWIDVCHYRGCKCKNVRADRKMSKAFVESTALHEANEFKLMEGGMPYEKAHRHALAEEIKAGILKDPYAEEYGADE